MEGEEIQKKIRKKSTTVPLYKLSNPPNNKFLTKREASHPFNAPSILLLPFYQEEGCIHPWSLQKNKKKIPIKNVTKNKKIIKTRGGGGEVRFEIQKTGGATRGLKASVGNTWEGGG